VVNSSYKIENVFNLDSGSNKMSYSKNLVQSFNGALYFVLYKNSFTSILTSLTQLSTSPLITITTLSVLPIEGLPNISYVSGNTFDSSYSLTLNGTSTTSNDTGQTLTVISPFRTFVDFTFPIYWPSSP